MNKQQLRKFNATIGFANKITERLREIKDSSFSYFLDMAAMLETIKEDSQPVVVDNGILSINELRSELSALLGKYGNMKYSLDICFSKDGELTFTIRVYRLFKSKDEYGSDYEYLSFEKIEDIFKGVELFVKKHFEESLSVKESEPEIIIDLKENSLTNPKN